MAKFNYENRTESGKKNVFSEAIHQRSACAVVVYPWKKVNITNIFQQDLKSKSSGTTSDSLESNNVIQIINDVIRCNITKNKSTPSGTFSLSLKRGKSRANGKTKLEDVDYLKLIHPGDWIAIYIRRGRPYTDKELQNLSPNSGLRMIGIVENIRYIEVENPGNAAPRLEYVITGKDFGKVFESNVFFNPQIANSAQAILGVNLIKDSNKVLANNRNNQRIGITPESAIKKVMEFHLGYNTERILDTANVTHQAWYIPPDLAKMLQVKIKKKVKPAFADIIDTSKMGLHKYSSNSNGSNFPNIKPLQGGTIPLTVPTSGTVWSTMEFLQHKVLNEMYVDLSIDKNGLLKPALILRQYPFSNRPEQETNPFKTDTQKTYKDPNSDPNIKTFFTELPSIKILSSDIKQKNIGKSDFERINHIMVVPQNPVGGSGLDLGFKSILNTASIKRYGLKSYQTYSNYIFDDNKENLLLLCERATAHLADWFLLAHLLYNGTLIIQGKNDHIELGMNIHITDMGQLFHIEGYSHTYAVNGDATTDYTIEVSISRGQFFVKNKSAFIGPSDTPIEQTTISSSSTEGYKK
jgi:hypothetical protein